MRVLTGKAYEDNRRGHHGEYFVDCPYCFDTLRTRTHHYRILERNSLPPQVECTGCGETYKTPKILKKA